MIGIFDAHGDVGKVLQAGTAECLVDSEYIVTGSGENMWFTSDAFHYVWKEARGDMALSADIVFPEQGFDPHRKAALMIRQSLDADSAYADAALHGDGLTSLQFRDASGELTHEVQSNITHPRRLRIEKRGRYVLMFVLGDSGEMEFSGAAARIEFQEPFYIGLAVCSHTDKAIETAIFSNLVQETELPKSGKNPVLFSTLETQSIASTDRRVRYVTATHIEAPNWLPDDSALIFNSDGKILSIPVKGGEPTTIDTGFAIRCNNDHGVSPDGTQLVISDQSQAPGQSLIYTVPIGGGPPTLVTDIGPSYWHGWSPDGLTLTYCAQRDGTYGIFTIPCGGGAETRLTTALGLDDGPEYSPDGAYIYFNSDRTGKMQIWRMHADGSSQEQVTRDEYNNWFAHPSPDGRYLVLLSYEPDVVGHPQNLDVTLRMITLESGKIDILARCFGGQGTINVPCWSPDSTHIAFVTYQLI